MKNVESAVDRKMKHPGNEENRRFDVQKKGMLLEEQRRARWDPPHFLAPLGLKPGLVVLDLGCGPGFWTMPLAEAVGSSGTVWALDVSREMLDTLARRNPPGQVRLVQSELPDIVLPDESIDFIWASFIFHEVTQPGELAMAMHRILKPGGALALLDWRPDAAGSSGPPRDQRLTTEQVGSHLESAGFITVAKTWQDDDNYLIVASRQQAIPLCIIRNSSSGKSPRSRRFSSVPSSR
jgi:ubiquinone/menaquinone biosynthesis C-methylase UbiE